jgi:hypothetical protein
MTIWPVPHAYQRSPYSGAGNCRCGCPERHRRHPHAFMRGWQSPPAGSETLCTCALPLANPIHVDVAMAGDEA